MVWNTEVGVERKGDESKYSGQPERWKRPCTKQKDERSIKWQEKQKIEDGRLCAGRDAGLGCAVRLSSLTT